LLFHRRELGLRQSHIRHLHDNFMTLFRSHWTAPQIDLPLGSRGERMSQTTSVATRRSGRTNRYLKISAIVTPGLRKVKKKKEVRDLCTFRFARRVLIGKTGALPFSRAESSTIALVSTARYGVWYIY
jgi:hypothetical protein